MEETLERTNFIWEAIDQDLESGRYQQIHTRFPPEPNGYMHIGHCKALIMDFLTAEKYGGLCNLRFDDTNPAKEDTEFVEAIKQDITWLGFHWTAACSTPAIITINAMKLPRTGSSAAWPMWTSWTRIRCANTAAR